MSEFRLIFYIQIQIQIQLLTKSNYLPNPTTYQMIITNQYSFPAWRATFAQTTSSR